MSDFEDFVTGCELDCVNARIAPEPIEAPEPQPNRYTYAQHKARVAAWQHLVYRGGVVVSFPLLCEALDAADESMRRSHRTALESVR
jgi:hypothetical protein